MTHQFKRELARTNIIPIDRVLAEENRQAREQWAASLAARQLRERQDEALRYLAIKQMEKDASFLSRLMRLFR